MCTYLHCYPPTLIFTGGSSGAPCWSNARRRKRNLTLNAEGVYVDDNVTLQRVKDDLREAAEEKKKRAVMRRKEKTA